MNDQPQSLPHDVLTRAALAERFVALADTLVDDFDVVHLMDELVKASVELLGCHAAGLLLRDPGGRLQLVASSSEETRLLELLQLQNDEGPCLDCIAAGRAVTVPRIAEASSLWPRFVPAAQELGFVSVHAVPLRLRDRTLGGLNLFSTSQPPMTGDDQRLAQALADVATIGLLQQETRHRASVLAEQLQGALHSRVRVEQAKGVLSEYAAVDMPTAFGLLRTYARSHGLKLFDVAEAVVRRTVELDDVLAR